MYMRTSRGTFTSVMMKEPLATVPRWYRTSLRTEDRIGVTGRRFLSLEHKVLIGAGPRQPWNCFREPSLASPWNDSDKETVAMGTEDGLTL